jgi:hypothetical protein
VIFSLSAAHRAQARQPRHLLHWQTRFPFVYIILYTLPKGAFCQRTRFCSCPACRPFSVHNRTGCCVGGSARAAVCCCQGRSNQQSSSCAGVYHNNSHQPPPPCHTLTPLCQRRTHSLLYASSARVRSMHWITCAPPPLDAQGGSLRLMYLPPARLSRFFATDIAFSSHLLSMPSGAAFVTGMLCLPASSLRGSVESCWLRLMEEARGASRRGRWVSRVRLSVFV